MSEISNSSDSDPLDLVVLSTSRRQLVQRDAVDLRDGVVADRVPLGIEARALHRLRLLQLLRERRRRLEERLRDHRLDELKLAAMEAPDERLVEGLSIE